MTRARTIWIACLVAAGCRSSAGTELLQQADLAVKALHAVRYAVSYKGAQIGSPRPITLTGRVTMSGWSNGPARLAARASVQLDGRTTALELGRDDQQFYLLERAQKLAHVGADAAVLGSAQPLLRALEMLELIYPLGFADELAADGQEPRGEREVEGVRCRQVHVRYQNGSEALWMLGERDHLPRGVRRTIETANGSFETEQLLADLAIDPPISDEEFAVPAPPGFTRTRAYAQ
jgi:hypothetical protein